MLPLIEVNFFPGAKIQWAVHSALVALPVSESHVDPLTDLQTNNAEGFQKNAKQKLKQMFGTCDANLPYYMDEFMWCQVNRKKSLDIYDNPAGSNC